MGFQAKEGAIKDIFGRRRSTERRSLGCMSGREREGFHGGRRIIIMAFADARTVATPKRLRLRIMCRCRGKTGGAAPG